MNDLSRWVKQQDATIQSQPSSAPTLRKVAICGLAALIGSVMLVWFGFLGWGFIAILQGLFH